MTQGKGPAASVTRAAVDPVAPAARGFVVSVTAATSDPWRGADDPLPLAGLITQGQLTRAVGSRRGVEAADRLCEACADLLGVDAVAISIVISGAQTGTLGVSSPAARIYDEVSFTLGEGPCLDVVRSQRPMIVADLSDPDLMSWTGYREALLAYDIRCVWSVPLAVAGEYVGALTIFRRAPGAPSEDQLAGVLAVAELAGMPLLDLIAADEHAAADADSPATDWSALTRIEVNQATGMLVAQLDVDPVEALARLRAHAYATGCSATDVARDILDRRVRLDGH